MATFRPLVALAIMLVTALALAGCDSNGSNDSTNDAATPLDPYNAAVLDLSRRTGVPVEEITLVSTQSKEWPNACLGLPRPDEVCAEVITPGNEVVLEAAGKRYVYRTDQVTSVRLQGEAKP